MTRIVNWPANGRFFTHAIVNTLITRLVITLPNAFNLCYNSFCSVSGSDSE